jgi:DNA-binding transcriptional regulator YiaG
MDDVFESIKRGLEQTLEHANGRQEIAKIHKPKSLDVKTLRETLEMKSGFAHALNISVNTLRHWEQFLSLNLRLNSEKGLTHST